MALSNGTPANDIIYHDRDGVLVTSPHVYGYAGSDQITIVSDRREYTSPYHTAGQSHQRHVYADGRNADDNVTYAVSGNDTINIFHAADAEGGFHQGVHAFGGFGADVFNFSGTQNITAGMIYTGRIDDFDPSQDKIQIDGTTLNLYNLPSNARIVEFNGAFVGTSPHSQQWLLVETSGGGHIFYALNAARYEAAGGNDEYHFINKSDLPLDANGNVDFDALTEVSYQDPEAWVPVNLYKNGGYNVMDISFTNGTDYQGTSAADVIHGFDGNDVIYGYDGNDLLAGGDSNDLIFGGNGNDMIWGGTENDTLNGGAGADSLKGGIGNDVYVIDNVGDVVTEIVNGGADRIDSSIAIDLNRAGGVYANVENLVLTGTTATYGYGTDAANSIIGNAANNNLAGRGGNDILMGGAGADTLNGGVGIDRASYTNAASRVVVDLADTSVNVGDAAGDTYSLIENVTGSLYNDWINGDAGANNIHGYDGNDGLNGQAGNDTLTGGAGSDTFVFAKNHDADRVVDFENNVDEIRLLNFGLTSFADAQTYATQSGDDVVFNFGDGDTLRIEGTTISALADDVIFV